ncbi:hypothetical protein ACM42_08350 [Bradyrhizobium sp. CCBAU 25338]|nr:hypothetical protein [Bradyrhizobium sp. CCBAU 45389]MDA9528443.1 hypothetical protein [Bradyrhizobium sp. CCBAU 25338]
MHSLDAIKGARKPECIPFEIETAVEAIAMVCRRHRHRLKSLYDPAVFTGTARRHIAAFGTLDG